MENMNSTNYTVGQTVEVFSFGTWYRGDVVSVTPKRVLVHYVTGSGKARDKWYSLAGGNALSMSGPTVRPITT